ncbi:MAG: hypothetical protein AAF690_25600 [Acidobacteriota bacterium]
MQARPEGIFSNDWIVTNDDGREVLLDLSAWRERAQFEVDGRVFELQKGEAFSGEFLMRSDGTVLARARKPSVFRNRFDLEVAGATFTLRKVSAMGRRFEVRQGETTVGEILPEGALTRRTQLNLPPDWTLETRLFVFWLVAVIWNREAQAVAS